MSAVVEMVPPVVGEPCLNGISDGVPFLELVPTSVTNIAEDERVDGVGPALGVRVGVPPVVLCRPAWGAVQVEQSDGGSSWRVEGDRHGLQSSPLREVGKVHGRGVVDDPFSHQGEKAAVRGGSITSVDLAVSPVDREAPDPDRVFLLEIALLENGHVYVPLLERLLQAEAPALPTIKVEL